MSAESYVMVVAHAPVFVPSASTVLAASGIDECTKPAALPSTSTLRGRCGLAGAVVGQRRHHRVDVALLRRLILRGGAAPPPNAGCGSAALKPAAS